MNCVERITEYGQLAPEGPEVLPYDPPKVWPYSGHLTCHEVKMSYSQDTPLALNGVTFEARPGEKIGVIGRTGAGKSSLVSALLRLTEVASGTITIDNVDTRSIGLTTVSFAQCTYFSQLMTSCDDGYRLSRRIPFYSRAV
jgi:ATP-binding cassette subfamily C (CFTR/MRP) protein 1